jgi:catechol 2,3-dioxygenase-like lactoylglutathione lyase family enzyme
MGFLTTSKAIAFVLTRDRATLEPFYRDVLGLRLLATDDFATTFDLNGATLRLTTVEAHVASPHTVLGWAVSDIKASVRAMTAQGVVFNIYPGFGQDDLGIWSAPGVKVAWFNDPEGNGLSITQM